MEDDRTVQNLLFEKIVGNFEISGLPITQMAKHERR